MPRIDMPMRIIRPAMALTLHRAALPVMWPKPEPGAISTVSVWPWQ
jgi:hypothetical protein